MWGRPTELWEWIGIRSLWVGAIAAFAALVLTTTSAFVLYYVADVAQKNLEQETQSSMERISTLDKQAESLRKDTAEANRKAEEEKIERLKLEAAVAPRTIGMADQQRIQETWRRLLAGHRVSLTSYALDGEGAMLASQIYGLLHSAGVDVDDRRASVMPMGGLSFGVQVTGTSREAVFAIRSVLKTSGIAAYTPPAEQISSPTITDIPPGRPSTTVADALVGIKPLPVIP